MDVNIFLTGITPYKAEQPLQGSELQGKEEQRLKHTGPII